MEREELTMQTKAQTHETTAPAPIAVQDRAAPTPTKSPKAFFEKMTKRPDINALLTRLAKNDQEEQA